jgi:hypothetical protein
MAAIRKITARMPIIIQVRILLFDLDLAGQSSLLFVVSL